jgi:hypothetical protein
VFHTPLQIRAKRLDAARKILGLALGTCPKDKLFKEYIQLELSLGNIDRCMRVCVSRGCLPGGGWVCGRWWGRGEWQWFMEYTQLELSLGNIDKCVSAVY